MDSVLRMLRKAKGHSVVEMANFFGVNDSTYRKWELGSSNMSFTTACDLADFFGVTLDELAGRTVPVLEEDEKEVLDCYRSTDSRGKAAIMAIAQSQRGAATVPSAQVI